MSLYPVISQKTYPGVGDIDDCAVIATFWAARAAGFAGALPTVAEFRAAAHRPDSGPGSHGLFNYQVWDGVIGTALGAFHPVRWERAGWDAFAAAVKGGQVASVAVDSAKLPGPMRFGFMGAHRIGVQWSNGWYLANPLAPDKSQPIPISEAFLKVAVLALGGGMVVAVSFPTQEGDMSAALITILVKPASPREFRTIPGVTLLGYDPLRPGVVVKSGTWITPSAAHFDAVVQIDQAPNPAVVPHGAPFLRVTDGAYKGLYIVAAKVTANIAPDPAPDVKHNLALTVDGVVVFGGTI